MIYIASPYTHEVKSTSAWRYSAVFDYTNYLMREKELTCFSPIVYGHQFCVQKEAPGNWEAWYAFNMHMLSNSFAMHILTLPGWEKSAGIAEEVLFCRRELINYYVVDPVTYTISTPEWQVLSEATA